jgi:hypothetical protein
VTIKIRTTSALLLSAVLLGCAEKRAPNPTPKAAPSAESVATPAMDILAEDACRQLAVRIEETMNAGDAYVFMSAFDVGALLDRLLAGLEVSDKQRMEFAASIKAAPNIALRTSRAIAKGGSFRLLRIHTADGEPRALFRQISGFAVNYQDLILARGRTARRRSWTSTCSWRARTTA